MKHCLLVVLAAFACIFSSCTKNKNPTPYLTGLTDSTTSVQSVTKFNYDNENRLSEIIITGQNACKRTFRYFGNTVVFSVTDTTPGTRYEIDTIVLNSAGLITTLSGRYPSNNEWYVQTFLYDATGKISTGSTMVRNSIAGDILEYLTIGGDIIYEKVKGNTVNKNEFTYYGTREIVYGNSLQTTVYGDPTDFRQLLYYGSYYYNNKHLLQVLAAPGSSYRAYTYTFDADRIATSTLRQWRAGNPDTVTHYISYSYSYR